ncbi:MAG: hypothetical protein KAT14_06715 [Candidatus Marinimicrobia bacterium]|nr:hypothetical protein [Candidatus Neomarinimicrobiota bacterium]
MLRKIALLCFCSLMLLSAVDPQYYIRRANQNYKQIDDMIVDLRIRSRMPQITIPDRETVLHFIRPDSLFLEDNTPLMIPSEVFLMDLERLVDDATSLRVIDYEEAQNNVVFIEVKKPIEGREIIFLAMVDTIRWVLSQMKMIDKPEMVADINFTQKEIFPGLYLPTDIRMIVESKETQKKKVPNPRGGIPITSSFGYIDLKFSNYRINTLQTSIVNPDTVMIQPDTLQDRQDTLQIINELKK